MLRKVLIANSGEIACRVARTCRRLGIEAVGVHSTADRGARHVREIGNSVEIGGAAPGESYLNIPAIVAAARSVGADAIHPGYGFLSENPDFVRALDEAGIGFLGPRPETLEQLGLKDAAKQKAAELGIPVVPGSEQAFVDADAIVAQVQEVGLPALLKAAAGGGGRGMRRVGPHDDLRAAIEAAMREAQAPSAPRHC